MRIISNSETDTLNLGSRLVRLLRPAGIVLLFGGLGAGKTVLVKGMAQGLGISKDSVISPSFVLIREYLPVRQASGRTPLYHLDLFRLTSPKDISDLGYEEYLYGQGICAIEWAERLSGFLPAEFLKVELEIKGQNRRVIKLIANGQRYRRILQGIRI
jgi:tRNA threonylcarbamoyladenosine biosynthesis protein TsaE